MGPRKEPPPKEIIRDLLPIPSIYSQFHALLNFAVRHGLLFALMTCTLTYFRLHHLLHKFVENNPFTHYTNVKVFNCKTKHFAKNSRSFR